MSVTQGMNVQEVQALGQALKSSAEQLRRLAGNVDRVTSVSSWAGPDSVRFKTQVWPQHRGGVLRVAGGLEEIGNIALRNASEQLRASDAGGMASPFGITVGALGGIAGLAAGNGFESFFSMFGGSLNGGSSSDDDRTILDTFFDGLELGDKWNSHFRDDILSDALKASGQLKFGGALSLAGGIITVGTSGYDLIFDQRTDDLAWLETSADGVAVASGVLGIVGGALLLASNPVGWTVAAVGGAVAVGALAVDTGLYIYDNWDEVVEFGEDVAEFAVDAAETVNTHVIQPAIEFGEATVDAAVDLGGVVLDAASDFGEAVIDGVSDFGGALADASGELWDGLTGWF